MTRLLILAASLSIAGCASDHRFVDETIVVTQDLALDGDVFKTNFRFNTPNVVFDGQGHTLDGDCNIECMGLVILADNVVVRNLILRRFDGGVRIARGVSGVTFENVTVTDNVNHGIYVDAEANGFTCKNCIISDNGTMGLYLEYNTHSNVIEDGEISFNGFRDKDTGDFFENQRNKRRDKREGVAIDSSQGNTILNTDFFGNALAAVTMYRNCGERGIPRELGASFNTIRGGSFSDDIIIASRQDMNLSEWDCLRPYVLDGRYVEDDAEFNVIENVTLEGNTRIVIQDDNNLISGVTGGRLVAGSDVRDTLLQPVTGIDIRNTTSNFTGDPSFVVE